MPSFSFDANENLQPKRIRSRPLASISGLVLLLSVGCSDSPQMDDGGTAFRARDALETSQQHESQRVSLVKLKLHNQTLESVEKKGWTLRSAVREKAEKPVNHPKAVAGRLGTLYALKGSRGDGAKSGMFSEIAAPAIPKTSAPEPRPVSKPSSKRPVSRETPETTLKAGTTDDNENFSAFKKFLLSWSDRTSTVGRVQNLDVRGRTYFRVENKSGKSIPMARVVVKDAKNKAVVWAGKTLGDGRLAYYPRIALPASKGQSEGGFLLEAAFEDETQQVFWDGKSPVPTLILDVNRPVREPLSLDVLFILDTTGSMHDELQRIKDSLLSVTEKLHSTGKEFDLRYGAVLYRDLNDGYITKRHPFVSDVELFSERLQSVEAVGGGDRAESLNQGLAVGLEQMKWRENSVKVAFVVADAPPHMDYEQDVPYGESALRALEKGIKIHMVAASGLQELGSLVFRQTAQLTQGKFIYIEYGGDVRASAAKHGVKDAPNKSNNLDDILFKQVQEELAQWGR